MIESGLGKRIFVVEHVVDFRRQHDGLLAEARRLQLNPFKGDFIIFVGRRKNRIKVLYADRTGLWVSCKQFTMEAMKTAFKFLSEPSSIQWPPSHPLYRAAQYVVKSFDQLTYYLQEPRIPWTTNAEEHGLRFEKCLLQAAKFSRNRNGSVVLNIVRTFVATQVELRDYFQWVYVNRQKLEDTAEKFTPYQYALHLASLPSKVKEPPKSAQASV